MENENSELEGLGGWLVLVGIGLVLSPIRLVFQSAIVFVPVFQDGTWQAITDPNSAQFIPYVGMLISFEILVNISFLLMGIALLYLFFTKHKLFPKAYIGFSIISVSLLLIDAWASTLVFPDMPMFDAETAGELARGLVAAAIWIPYMLVSKRVKATFIHPKEDETVTP